MAKQKNEDASILDGQWHAMELLPRSAVAMV